MTPEKRKVLIVDDHPVVRLGMRQLIDLDEKLITCGEAQSAYQALEQIFSLKPDIVVVDICLEEVEGIELIRQIRAGYPDLPILAVSMHDESVYAERILRAGGMGYIMKKEATAQIVAAIHRVLDGEIYISDAMTSKFIRQHLGPGPEFEGSPPELLTDRELEVFSLIGRGVGTREIASRLQLSIKTIESYRAHIKEKLKLETAFELVHYAIIWVEKNP